jgi:hypothetical protein
VEGVLDLAFDDGKRAGANSGSPQIPAVLFFERVDVNSVLDLEDLPMKADPSVLCEDINISRYAAIAHPPSTGGVTDAPAYTSQSS